MRILAVDTATEVCGVALARESGDVAAELCLNRGRTHTGTLMAAIEAVLSLADLSLKQVDAFAVTRGPGSFTGLRIGISTVKGLALATGKPLLGVSSLAALTCRVPEGITRICPMIDARRHQVYWSLYERHQQGLVQIHPETVGPPREAAGQVAGPCLFVGNGARLYNEQLRAALSRPEWLLAAGEGLDTLSAAAVARLAGEQLRRGEWVDVHRFAPLYIRPSDARLNV
ncbi:tRNA (adenosine(37)-N6)-threonylcarbamoyltransferase complex dimerization subunit type 1 TsaB [Desulfatitalea alkaliphila]|uniref:tRNA (Adenosine(37)-N6)-threonylcarbamoyltransferase complex dimerization subunit type 1 TsaB n=1 Tax=Desulfatitalea alkaliphila TaxID=2929485 RepID=A0AA41UKS3_9BACT|nr:tRNA (adenosine(37)-N6)-threonylcarbamoyltransferase complex dimerization subunit type 1 TsaB [Desulfatitalea alkaliphila]MCJ8501732.1 tRNA (adenosine(37)-N6)-threonylcarbamoyltransferase complex dimerization subunit type 1 TsaB [Desulfatitalea alkaliphila]